MDIDNEKTGTAPETDGSIDLSAVVRAVKHASDAELRVLAEISDKISGQEGGASGPTQKSSGQALRKRRSKPRSGEIELSSSSEEDKAQAKAVVVKAVSPRISTQAARQIEQPKSTAPDSVPQAARAKQESRQEVAKPIAEAVKDSMADFSSFWKDEKGRLRTGNGRYASKDEKAAYEQSAANVAQEREKEREKGVVAKLVSSIGGAALGGVDALAKNDAADTAGAAAGGSWFYAAKEVYQLGDSIGELAERVKGEGSLFAKAKGLASGLFGKKDEQQGSMIDTAKDQSAKVKQTALIQEQTSDQIASNEKIIDLLTEIADDKKSKGGLLDNVSIGDMFGRGRGRGGAAGGKGGKGGRRGRMRSVLSGGGKAAGAAGAAGAAAGGKKGLSMAGKAFKGVSSLAKGAGKLVPFLAPALAAYDAFDGFTNKEKQKETFNLKEGQEATFGQKSAMAAANVLNLGGLVSGGAGLLGDALGAVGFDGAKEALNFDVGDMTKGIYDFFGGNKDKAKKADEVAKTQEAAKVQEASASVSESAASKLTTASDKMLKASENFLKAIGYVDKQPVFASGGHINPQAPSFMKPSKPAVNPASTDNYGVPALLQRPKVSNESVTQIQAANSQKKLKESGKAQLVTLDEPSIKAIGQASSVVAPATSNKDKQKGPVAPYRSVGFVPADFSDSSLRRQSADLE